MFNNIKRWLKKDNNVQETVKKEIIEPDIEFIKEENMLKMMIPEGVSLDTFFKKVRELNEEDKKAILALPLNILCDGMIGSRNKARSGNYLWFNVDIKRYFIVINNSELLIDEMVALEDVIEERDFSYYFGDNDFTITKKLHDKNYSTLEHKRFDSDDNDNSNPLLDSFSLSMTEAKSSIKELFNNLEEISNTLATIIDINKIKEKVDDYFQNNLEDTNQAKR